VDFRRPVTAVIPDSQGQILASLAAVSGPLTLRGLSEVCGVSPAQCSRVLKRLVALGMVQRTDVPPAALFSLVRDHVASELLIRLADAHGAATKKIEDWAKRIRPTPQSVLVFGSFARGVADIDSDIDILIVRPALTETEESSWVDSRAEFEINVRRCTGNPVKVIEVERHELDELLKGPLWSEIARGGKTVLGTAIGAPG